MKRLLLIPTMLLPYSVSFAYFLSKLFTQDVAIRIFGILLAVCFVAATVCNVIYMILSKKDDSRKLIRDALLVKLIHVPAYVIVFMGGSIAALMIFFTLPLILMLVAFDCIILFWSSMLSVFALILHVKHAKTLSVIALVCQCIFCADVISLLVLDLIDKHQKSPLRPLSPAH